MEAILAVTPSETIKYVVTSTLLTYPSVPTTSPPSLSDIWTTLIFGFNVRRTKLIDDAKRPRPRYRGLVHGTASIVREEGLLGIYRGLFPVVSTPDLFQ